MQEQREYKNIIQNPHSYFFSTDALLLAEFVSLDKVSHFVELGTGCGIVALEIIHRQSNLTALGIDKQEELIETARENAKQYHFENNIEFVCADLNAYPYFNDTLKSWHKKSELVVCNPPWLLLEHGKTPQSVLRREALFGDKNTYHIFFRAARYFLKERGKLSLISVPHRLPDVFQALKEYGFCAEKMQFVHNTFNENAIFVLISALFIGKKISSFKSELTISEPYLLKK